MKKIATIFIFIFSLQLNAQTLEDQVISLFYDLKTDNDILIKDAVLKFFHQDVNIDLLGKTNAINFVNAYITPRSNIVKYRITKSNKYSVTVLVTKKNGDTISFLFFFDNKKITRVTTTKNYDDENTIKKLKKQMKDQNEKFEKKLKIKENEIRKYKNKTNDTLFMLTFIERVNEAKKVEIMQVLNNDKQIKLKDNSYKDRSIDSLNSILGRFRQSKKRKTKEDEKFNNGLRKKLKNIISSDNKKNITIWSKDDGNYWNPSYATNLNILEDYVIAHRSYQIGYSLIVLIDGNKPFEREDYNLSRNDSIKLKKNKFLFLNIEIIPYNCEDVDATIETVVIPIGFSENDKRIINEDYEFNNNLDNLNNILPKIYTGNFDVDCEIIINGIIINKETQINEKIIEAMKNKKYTIKKTKILKK